MEGFFEPHPTQIWLVDAFFRLHRRRDYSEAGPKAISYQDMVILADDILRLRPVSRDVYFQTIEATDSEVLEFLFNRNTAKLEGGKTPNKGTKK